VDKTRKTERKKMAGPRIEQLNKEIQELKILLRDREAALPAHSVRPHQIQEIEELEERIAAAEKELDELAKG
jgi:hypothetical protein